jgi:CO/xanthine dehydrogenase FAD-binding subunit
LQISFLNLQSPICNLNGGEDVTTTDLFVPRSVDEALELLRKHGAELTVMGGGTIVMGLINDGRLFPHKAMSLARAGMAGVRDAGDYIEIGAAATIAQLSRLESLPILAEAANLFGGPAVRGMATVGGNLFAAPPAGDIAVPLLALDAEVELASPTGRRALALDQFFAGQGQTARAPDELVVSIRVLRPAGHSAYLRYGRRQANTPSVVAVAVRVVAGRDQTVSDARIALGAAGPHALRARQAEAALIGNLLDEPTIAAAAEAAQAECDPPTDALASAWYRRRMVGVYMRRVLESLGQEPRTKN